MNILKNYFKYYVLFLVMVTLLLSINLAQALTDQPSNTSTTKTQPSASDASKTHTVPTKIQQSILIPNLKINRLPSNTSTTPNTSTTSVPSSVNSKSTNSSSPTGSSVGTSTSVSTSISRSSEQSKAFTQWLKTACADRSSQGSKNECYKDRINDVANLSHTINVAISKEQAYCSKLSSGQRKTECDNSVFKTVAKNSQAYLGTPTNSFI